MHKPFYKVETYRGCKSVGYLIKRIFTLMMPPVEAVFAGSELSFSQWVVLMCLRDGIGVAPDCDAIYIAEAPYATITAYYKEEAPKGELLSLRKWSLSDAMATRLRSAARRRGARSDRSRARCPGGGRARALGARTRRNPHRSHRRPAR